MFATDRLKDAIKWGVPDPILFRASPRVVRWYAEAMTWYTCGRHYNAPIFPTEIIQINPAIVDSKLNSESYARFRYSNAVCEVVGGRWDKKVKNLDNYDFYNSLIEHFDRGVPWEETAFYHSISELIQTGESRWECDTLEEFDKRLDEIDLLYNNIKENGYQRQRIIEQSESKKPAHRKIHAYWPAELNEVIVNVGRDGDLILHDGRHRFIIAKILQLDSIPVRIKTRHKDWQKIRDEAINNPSKYSEYTDHPDVNNINKYSNSSLINF